MKHISSSVHQQQVLSSEGNQYIHELEEIFKQRREQEKDNKNLMKKIPSTSVSCLEEEN